MLHLTDSFRFSTLFLKYDIFTEEQQTKFRLWVFFIWAVYGIVPTIHWVWLQQGGPIVDVMVPRIVVMYIICGAAFFFYLTKMPERLMPGLVDIFGHSHQVHRLCLYNLEEIIYKISI